jgi:hypothetical protein
MQILYRQIDPTSIDEISMIIKWLYAIRECLKELNSGTLSNEKSTMPIIP